MTTVTAHDIHRLIDGLSLRPLLDGKRGAAASDIPALATALARFSTMVADLSGLVQEIDINPLLAGPKGCVALDALIVPAARKQVPKTKTRR